MTNIRFIFYLKYRLDDTSSGLRFKKLCISNKMSSDLCFEKLCKLDEVSRKYKLDDTSSGLYSFFKCKPNGIQFSFF